MDEFWRLLEESVIIQGAITLMLVGAVLYMAVAGMEIPPLLGSSLALTLGFYFGSKSEQTIQRRTKDIIKGE